MCGAVEVVERIGKAIRVVTLLLLLGHPLAGSNQRGGVRRGDAQPTIHSGPEIIWSRKHGSLSSGAKYQEGPVYSIHNISRHQAGVYRCQASNGVGQPVFEDINLTVLYSPEVSAELGVVHTGVGVMASLSCIVNANPAASVRWYRDSLMLDSDNHFLLESKGSLHTFIIRKMRRENFGTYSCSASNTFGKQSAHVLITGKPKTPVFQSNILSKRSHSHSVTWVTESYSSLTEYRLIYRKILSDSEGDVLYVWTTLTLRPAAGEGIYYNKTYILDNLEQDSKYEVKVEARNEFGWSHTSEVFRFFTRNTDDSPKQLPIEPEKTPAPSTEYRFSSASSSGASLLLLLLCFL